MTTELTTTETTIAAALERLANEHQRWSETAEKCAERTFFRSWAGAFRKALYHYQTGIRPQPTPAGAWLVTSATRGGMVHQVDRIGACTCEAGQKHQACWHAALAAGVEVGMDDLDRFDGGDDEAPTTDPPTPILVTRVAGGIALDRAGEHAIVSDSDPTALRSALQAFGARLCAARRPLVAGL